MLTSLRSYWSRLSYRHQLWLLLLPYLLGTLILIVIPAFATVLIAFTKYKPTGVPIWNGFENVRKLLASPLVRISLRHSVAFLLLAVPLRLLIALSLALLLQRKSVLFGFYRAAIYLPTIIPEAAYALLWLWILNPLYGPLNMVLRAIGLPAPAWLTGEETAVLAMVIMSLFQIGEGFIVILAALQSVSRSIYEAAKIDGASTWQTFWHITLPLITPWLLILTFRDLIVSLQNTFAPTYIMTYGGPYYATTFVPLLIYEIAFDQFDLGLASALLLLTYLLIGLISFALFNLISVSGEYKRSGEE